MPKRKQDEIDIDQELEELNAHLKELATSTRFAVDGEAFELPSVIGINVKDFGELSLPLKDPQASELIKRCGQSSFGKNSETCLDTNVRDSYQLEPSQFKIDHLDWDKKLQQLVTRVAIELGTDAKVEAKIYKLLVYKQGGHFLKHKDTEKENRMFATLIIQLPSVYSGGELVVYDQNGDQERKIDFGQSTGKSQYSMNFAAHYADLDHELLEVKSGYRLALVYSICWVTGNVVNKSINTKIKDQKLVLKNINNLFGSDTNKSTLGVFLDHYYTDQSLTDSGIGALKGIDNARYSVLSQANSFLPSERQLAFYICEAKLSIEYAVSEFESESEIDHYLRDDVDKPGNWVEDDEMEQRSESFELVDWRDINGSKIECDKSYIEDALEEDNFFINVLNPSKGLIGLNDKDTWAKLVKLRIGFFGNDAAKAEYEYKKYLLVLFPRNQLQTMIAIDFGGAIDSIYRTAIEERKTTDSEMRSNIEEVCFGLCTQYSRAKKLTARSFSQIFQLLTMFNMQKEFESILDKCTIKINQECAKRLGLAISQFGFDSLKNTLEKFLKPSVGNFTNICALVKMIYDDNQTDVALKMFVHFLLPLITNPKKCDEIMKTAFGHICSPPNNEFEFDESCQPDNVLIVAKFFELYMQQTSAMSQLFKDSMLKFMNENSEWTKIIDVVGKEKQQSTFLNCQPLLEILEKRKKCLEEKAAQESNDQSNSDELEKLNRFFSQ